MILAGVASIGGGAALAAGVSPLPPAVSGLLAPLAAANRPLVLITLGVLFQPVLPRLQVRPARFCLPRHMMPLTQETRVQGALNDMAGKCLADIACHVMGFQLIQATRIHRALDDEAGKGLADIPRHVMSHHSNQGTRVQNA